LAKLTKRQLRSLAEGKTVGIAITTNKAGRVTLTARARLGGTPRSVGSAQAQAARAGRVTARLRLNKAALTRIKKAGRLKVTLSARVAGQGQASAKGFTLTSQQGTRKAHRTTKAARGHAGQKDRR
jgi:hypothetical protein